LNDTFQYRLNTALIDAPIVGGYFDSLPTKAEKKSQIKSIATYFLDISADRAVDKLILINTDEKSMYDEIVKTMLQIDPNATKIILEDLRAKQLKGDAVSTTLDEITDERNQELQGIASDLESIPFSSLKAEMYKILNDGLNGYSRLARIFEQMDAVKAYELLSLLDDVDEASVLDAMELSARNLIQQEKNKDLANTQKIVSLSEIYASKDADELITSLANTALYKIEELAIVFKELGVVKTGQILAKAGDDTFVNEVITQMKNNEVLENGEDLITKDILKSLKIFKDFDDNIIELTNVYKTMQPAQIASVISKLLTDGALPQVYVLDGGEVITISDEDLAYKILDQFDDKTKAEIIGNFNNTLASEVSKKLTVPEY
jgi:Mg/Co/Ni transporter MgtE